MSDQKQKKDDFATILEKLDNFSAILEKFGLDLITKIGQQNSKIHILTDKINELNKATLQIKSLAPQLNNIIESQKYLESEIDLIKSLIQKRSYSKTTETQQNEFIERDLSEIEKKNAILNQFEHLKTNLNNLSIQELKDDLEVLKDNVFEYTGGHKMLYEISKILQELKSEEEDSENIKEKIREKLEYWKLKL